MESIKKDSSVVHAAPVVVVDSLLIGSLIYLKGGYSEEDTTPTHNLWKKMADHSGKLQVASPESKFTDYEKRGGGVSVYNVNVKSWDFQDGNVIAIPIVAKKGIVYSVRAYVDLPTGSGSEDVYNVNGRHVSFNVLTEKEVEQAMDMFLFKNSLSLSSESRAFITLSTGSAYTLKVSNMDKDNLRRYLVVSNGRGSVGNGIVVGGVVHFVIETRIFYGGDDAGATLKLNLNIV